MDLVILFFLAALQNAAFTWVSRSRNAGDVGYHAVACTFSNGIWFVMTVLIWERLWTAVTTGDYVFLTLTGIFYVAGTVIGSCAMMILLLKTEKGKRRVGQR